MVQWHFNANFVKRCSERERCKNYTGDGEERRRPNVRRKIKNYTGGGKRKILNVRKKSKNDTGDGKKRRRPNGRRKSKNYTCGGEKRRRPNGVGRGGDKLKWEEEARQSEEEEASVAVRVGRVRITNYTGSSNRRRDNGKR